MTGDHIVVLNRAGDAVFSAGLTTDTWASSSCRPGSACVGRPVWSSHCPLVTRMPARLRQELLRALEGILAGGGPGYRAEYRFRSPQGPCWFAVRVAGVQSPEGGAVVVFEDITQRKYAEQQDALLREIDRRFLQHQPFEAVLQLACRRLTTILGLPLAYISLKCRDYTARIEAAAGAARGFLQGVSLRWDQTPEGEGPTGKAIRTGRPHQGEVETDPTFGPWRGRARSFRLRSFLAIPLIDGDQPLGALCLFGRQSPAVPAESVALLHAFANRVAVSIREAEYRQQVRLLTAALSAAAHGLAITDRSGVIQWANPALTRLTGYTADEMVGRTPRMFRSGKHDQRFYEGLWEAVLAGESWRGEVVNRRKDGSLYREDLSVTPVPGPDGAITHFVAIKEDATRRREHEEHIRHLTLHDPVTGLSNRQALLDALRSTVERARQGVPAALLILDVDNFAVVNETLGYASGDRLLALVAQRLVGQLRPGDLPARVGPDEFAVLLSRLGAEEAWLVAERLRSAVAGAAFDLDGRQLELTLSVAVVPLDGELLPEEVFGLADRTLYAAKAGGTNRSLLVRSDDPRAATLLAAGRWVGRIQDALRDGNLMLHFQPVVRVASQEPEYWEVLVRLREADGTLTPPGAFLPAAERFGLMPQIDRWVLDQILPMLEASPDLRLFVNLAGASLGDEELLGYIESRVRQSGVRPGQLTLEITETTAVRDVQQVQHWMNRLACLGCRFALDDFGAGFSSFFYMRTLPVDYVKIDGSFIRNLDSDPSSRAIVRAAVAMAHALGKQVVAEWVENETTARHLSRLRVEFGQGYYWGRPSPGLPRPAVAGHAAGAGATLAQARPQ